MSDNKFAVRQGGKQKVYQVNRAKVNIPGFGVMTAEEFVQNASAISYVMSNEVLQVILKEVAETSEEATPAKPKTTTTKKTKKS